MNFLSFVLLLIAAVSTFAAPQFIQKTTVIHGGPGFGRPGFGGPGFGRPGFGGPGFGRPGFGGPAFGRPGFGGPTTVIKKTIIHG
ncbi:unnamed protein product [Caenorhabditis bovis]|uniref:Uncharacterized protein n=1 Tax=Caenorhabditis bovis TaxID=2654633 RepID=A0A8S1EF95_9PELO|nr:unnamed protein product [Caenorhabditis bovis]